ncbi:hypothetical protein [Saccharothrix variisporea]|uniref:Uncharacterized protein n=1 Tax=Saccharothrix variisporea TaxID=543527 RepID=A0A495WZM8_9PSEU|nr:hypothetical protein [Saccharothrix variisporea]RKT67097.1 hypothetical protein DFJ66_0265 [Saccharothrix variisporea]
MAIHYVDRDSVEYLGVRVVYRNTATGATDPTAYTVTVALVLAGTRPVSGDYQSASWALNADGHYVAQRLVSGLTASASYDVYVKVAASPETWVGKSPDTVAVR